jgi:sugar lactone lactonase YvrE/predicted small lipoprotein YifL
LFIAQSLHWRDFVGICRCAGGCVPVCLCNPAERQYSGVEKMIHSGGSLPGVAVDSNGVLYIADEGNHQVLKETPAGTGFTETMVGPASGARSFTPVAVAVDQFLNVYISDASNQRVLKETWLAGAYTETVVASGLGSVQGLAVDASQDVFVVDAGNQVILREQWTGSSYSQTVLTTIGGLIAPGGIAVDANSDLFITDNASGSLVQAIWQGGTADNYTVTPIWLAGGDPSGVAIDANGNLYIVGQTADDPLYFETWNGGTSYTETELATTNLGGSYGVALGPNGTILIADTGNSRVVEEQPGAAANLGAVAVGGASAPATMLFAFSGVQTGVSPSVLTQGAPGLDFTDALSGTCTTNGVGYTYDTTTGTNYRDSRNLFCSLNVTLTPGYPGSRYGAAVLQQSGAPIATGYAYGSGTGPELAFLNPNQSHPDGSLTSVQGVAIDSAGNLYMVDTGNNQLLMQPVSGSVSVVSTSTLSQPYGVAVDGAGNIYVADSGNNRVIEETPAGGGYTESTVPTSGLAFPQGVAVDGSGNVYVADSQDNRVLKETLVAGSYSETLVSASLSNPQGVAADAAGDVYIADPGHNQVLLETLTAGSYSPTVIGSGLSSPTAVAVDGAGNVFVADDAGNSRVLLESLSGGTYIQTILRGNTGYPTGMAVDGASDVYYVNGTLRLLAMSGWSGLNIFPDTVVGSTSSAQTETIEDVGNATLNFPVPGSGINPSINPNFTINGSGGSACPSLTSEATMPGTLAAGASCVLSIEFSPLTTGSITGTLTLTDNSLNTVSPNYATQSILLYGTGLAPPDSTTVAVGLTPATIDVGQSTLIQVTVADTTSGSTTPTGTVAISDGGMTISAAAALSGGTASVSYSPAGSGGHTISAVYTPSDSTVFSGSSNTALLTVLQVPAITFSVPNHTYGDAAFAVSASSASSGAFTYAVVSGPATIFGATVTLTGAGTVVLSASQAANGSYGVGSQNASFTVAAEVPAITFTVPSHTYGDVPFVVSASSASSGVFTYAVVSGPATISGATVTLTGAGTVVLTASQVANGSYGVGSQNASFTVATEVPAITFIVPSHTYGDVSFALTATSASSGAFTYAVVSGSATISGSTATLTGAGTVVLSASQAANGNYAVGSHNASFTVATEVPAITFTVPSHTYGDVSFALTATSASSGAFTYAVVSGPATISGATVTLSGAGTVVLSASQAANGNYGVSSQNASFTVATGVSTIIFIVPSHTYGDLPFTVSASSASSGTFTYAVVSGPASISGSTVTLTGAGTVVLSASQAANGSYLAGSHNATLTVALEAPELAFVPIATQTTNGVPFVTTASDASSAAIVYSVASGPATISGTTVTVTGTGTVVLSAVQGAAGNYAAANATVSFAVTGGFTIAGSGTTPGTASTDPGGTATFLMAMTPGSGTTFVDAVSFAATGLPVGATADFLPAEIIPGTSGPITVTLTIHTSSQVSDNQRRLPGGPQTLVALGLLLLPLAGTKNARRRLRQIQMKPVALIAAFLLLAAMAGLSGCGSSGPSLPPPTNYTILVTATDMTTGAHSSTSLTLTVQ